MESSPTPTPNTMPPPPPRPPRHTPSSYPLPDVRSTTMTAQLRSHAQSVPPSVPNIDTDVHQRLAVLGTHETTRNGPSCTGAFSVDSNQVSADISKGEALAGDQTPDKMAMELDTGDSGAGEDSDLKKEQSKGLGVPSVERSTADQVHSKSGVSDKIAGMAISTQLYCVPPWSGLPGVPYSIEVLKDGSIIEKLDVSLKGAYMFGRSDLCDFMLEHPTISRHHAVLQYKRNGDAFIYDLGSTHGTFVNKTQIQAKLYVPLHVGDIFKFGLSTRLFVLQGPMELMPKEGPTKAERRLLREFQAVSEQADCEASLLRSRREAMAMEGVTWGMMEDAIEEDIQENEEVTWQNYKGQLTEKQQKTLEKIQKRNEKLSSLRKEIDAIQAKEIPQGGLTQGQQTQVARNEQRIEQIMEELESLEETLNQSIQESIGARAGKRLSGRRKEDEEDEYSSDDDDFYDRTSKRNKNSKAKAGDTEIVETAESLLVKRDKLSKEIKSLSESLEAEGKKHFIATENVTEEMKLESQDPLDEFMTGVSSTLVKDRATLIRNELDKQRSDLNRITNLLKIADPTGEASRRWDLEVRTQIEKPTVDNILCAVQNVLTGNRKAPENELRPRDESSHAQDIIEPAKVKTDRKNDLERDSMGGPPPNEHEDTKSEGRTEERHAKKGPVWLGAGRDKRLLSEKSNLLAQSEDESCNKDFLDYRERKMAKVKSNTKESLSAIPEDAAGLILRKPINDVEETRDRQEHKEEEKIWAEAAAAAADAVALLLKHKRGLGNIEEEVEHERKDLTTKTQKEAVEAPSTNRKRKLGPEKPAFLNKAKEEEYQSWLPPEGQTGDGRTALNDRLGY